MAPLPAAGFINHCLTFPPQLPEGAFLLSCSKIYVLQTLTIARTAHGSDRKRKKLNPNASSPRLRYHSARWNRRFDFSFLLRVCYFILPELPFHVTCCTRRWSRLSRKKGQMRGLQGFVFFFFVFVHLHLRCATTGLRHRPTHGWCKCEPPSSTPSVMQFAKRSRYDRFEIVQLYSGTLFRFSANISIDRIFVVCTH